MAQDFEAQPILLDESNPGSARSSVGLVDVTITLIVVVILLAFSVMALGCASPGGQFVAHTPGALRLEGPPSANASLSQQDGTATTPGSRSMVGGFGPSQVIADYQGVSAASTLAQNTGTVRLPYDLNRDGVLGEGEIVVLNVSGNSDFAVQEVLFTYYDADNKPLSTVRVAGVSSLNSTIGPSVAPMVTEIARAYTAASADRRAEYDRYMETAQVAIKEGWLAFSDALAMGLKILTGGASAVIPSP